MIDLASAWDLVALAVAVAVSLGILRLLTGNEPVNLGAPFAFRAPDPWPRGVQEEDPAPWRLDLLDRRPRAARPVDPAVRPTRPVPRRAPRPAVATDPC